MTATFDPLREARHLHHAGKLTEAVDAYRVAINVRESAAAFNDLGDALHSLGRLAESAEAFGRAIQLDPNHVQAMNNMGLCLRTLGRSDDAVVCLQQAIRLKPDLAALYSNLALALEDEGLLGDAIRCYRQALRINPHNHAVHSNLLLALNYDPKQSAASLFKEHALWGETHGRAVISPHQNNPDPDRRLRVGYVSSDFRSHPAVYFIEPILIHHDRAQFEVFGYGNVAAADGINQRLAAHCDQFICVWSESDEQLARRIRNDRIDILVDLAGHTADNRLTMFALKPAPVQATFLGYQNTTGLPAIDYRITDAIGDPPGSERDYVESLVRLGDSIVSFQPSAAAPAISPMPVLATGVFTFGSHHRLIKLNAEVIALWTRILSHVPRSRLVIFPRSLSRGSMKRITEQFRARGVDPARLTFHHRHVTGKQYLDVFAEVDLVLDAFPNGAGATAYESMWMGVPMVTLRGDRFAGRIGASLTSRVGLSDFVASDIESYFHIATGLAASPSCLTDIRASMRERMKTGGLCDAGASVDALESAYREMWRKWCQSRDFKLCG